MLGYVNEIVNIFVKMYSQNVKETKIDTFININGIMAIEKFSVPQIGEHTLPIVIQLSLDNSKFREPS